MRVAIYHNLPAGGALRALRDFVSRCDSDIHLDVFTLDARAADVGAITDPTFSLRDLSRWVDLQHRELIPFTGNAWMNRSKLGRYLLTWGVRVAERRVADAIDTGGYDVAYVHGCWISQTPSILGDLTLPTVYYMQEVRRATFEPGLNERPSRPSGPLPGVRWWLSERLEDLLRRRDIRAAAAPDTILCNSRYSAGTIRAAYGRTAQLAYLGVDTDLFGGSTPATRHKRVMSVGAMEAVKGHHLIVEALGLLPPEERPLLALVYERFDDAYRTRVLGTAQQLGVEVTEHRGITDEALAELYATSEATMVAARLEPFGLVPLESMASGTPVVATRSGGYLETVEDGISGVLVDPVPRALAEGLQRLRVLADDHLTERLRAIAVERWSMVAAVARQEEALRDTARGGHR